MAEETKKEGFFKKVIKSIKDFDQYEDFAIEKPTQSLKYLVKLVAIFCAIICIVYTYKIVTNMNHLYTGMKEKVPEFSYEDGELITQTEEPTIIEEYGEMIGTVIIDTSAESKDIFEKYDENIKKFGSAFIFTKNNLVIYNPRINGQLVYQYADIASTYQLQNFSKQDVINYVENMNVISISFSVYCMIFVYTFILYFMSILMDVIILSLLAYIVSRFSRIRLKYAPSFSVAVHSITLPVILNLIYIIVNLLTGFEVKYFALMYNTIAYIYVIVAILMIKTDFINRQAELIKLAQEQMKVKEELEKQKEEKEKEEKPVEKDNKKQENKDEQTENKKLPKDKKQKQKKEPSSDEPIGDATCNGNE